VSKRSNGTAANEGMEPATPIAISARDKAIILKAVADKHGILTPDLVVREANPANSEGVAHRLAESVGWNKTDEVAAYKWRLDQARATIRAATPLLIELGVMTLSAPHYVRNPMLAPREQGYVELASLRTQEAIAEDVLQSEIARAVGCLERAYVIAEALGKAEDAANLMAALAALGRAPLSPGTAAAESVARAG